MAGTADRVELRTWSGCPSHDDALALLRRALMASGSTVDRIQVTWVETEELAAELGFVGSPTFAVDGVDVYAPGDAAPALTCRVYQRPDGRFRPLPDPDDLTARLAAALAAGPAVVEEGGRVGPALVEEGGHGQAHRPRQSTPSPPARWAW